MIYAQEFMAIGFDQNDALHRAWRIVKNESPRTDVQAIDTETGEIHFWKTSTLMVAVDLADTDSMVRGKQTLYRMTEYRPDGTTKHLNYSPNIANRDWELTETGRTAPANQGKQKRAHDFYRQRAKNRLANILMPIIMTGLLMIIGALL